MVIGYNKMLIFKEQKFWSSMNGSPFDAQGKEYSSQQSANGNYWFIAKHASRGKLA